LADPPAAPETGPETGPGTGEAGVAAGLRAKLRHRARVVEAVGALVLARLLLTLAPLSRWQGSLGTATPPNGPMPGMVDDETGRRARRAARAVTQAVRQVPFEAKCLPQAMALQWMLRRRRVPARLLIGVLPAADRDAGDGLHAWVSVGHETVIGKLAKVHRALLALDTFRDPRTN